MPALCDNLNVWNTCLAILREHGYDLSIEADDPNADLSDCHWVATKDGYDLWASDPIQLLGLSSIHGYHAPKEPPSDYWWRIDGPDIMDELIQKRWPERETLGEQAAP